LTASLSSYVFTFESRVAGACVSLVKRVNALRGDSLSFCDDLAV
jgi:hypothetical protein